jgi:hypothetical protein
MRETRQMEDIEDGQWLTLAELADARHTSEASATRLVRRHEQWQRQRDNQGHVRVLVPTEALTADVREDVLVPPVIDSAVDFRIDGSAMTEMRRDRETSCREEVCSEAQR